MRRFISLLSLTLLILSCETKPTTEESPKKAILVIHGGAGTITRDKMAPETEEAYKQALMKALMTGYGILKNGGESCEAVMAAINLMEDDPLFNAGKGAVFTSAETNELDASIMSGSDKNAGAVAGVKTIKNPINAAYEVMVSSPHVMLSGDGADQFGSGQGLETVEPGYFHTDRRHHSLKRTQKLEKEHGTVGAVALDMKGNLCAGTSTGGMTNKKWGRIGDSPIIGAGTYADNNSCGVSCTGHGEFFIRSATAYEVAALMKYQGLPLEEAAQKSIDQTAELGGKGGLIALDTLGNVAMPFSTEGMYRGYVTGQGKIVVEIFGD